MKNLLIILAIFAISCSEQVDETDQSIVLFPDSTNYQYYRVSDSLTKVIRFYPGTMDTNYLYFYNIQRDFKDSISYRYSPDGILKSTIKYKDNMRYKYLTRFYEDGSVKEKMTFLNDKLWGDQVFYYPNGEIKREEEWIQIRDKSYINRIKAYKPNGHLDSLHTYYVEMNTSQDTISIGDSIDLKITSLIPTKMRLIVGDFNSEYEAESSDYIFKDHYYYKPKKNGNDTIRVIVEQKIRIDNAENDIARTFFSKSIFVTEEL